MTLAKVNGSTIPSVAIAVSTNIFSGFYRNCHNFFLVQMNLLIAFKSPLPYSAAQFFLNLLKYTVLNAGPNNVSISNHIKINLPKW